MISPTMSSAVTREASRRRLLVRADDPVAGDDERHEQGEEHEDDGQEGEIAHRRCRTPPAAGAPRALTQSIRGPGECLRAVARGPVGDQIGGRIPLPVLEVVLTGHQVEFLVRRRQVGVDGVGV